MSRQATARKKILDKFNIEEIKPSTRRFPAIIFKQERYAGDKILEIKNLSQLYKGQTLFKNISLTLNKGDKIAIYSKNSQACSTLYDILSGSLSAQKGDFTWGLPLRVHTYLSITKIFLIQI